MLYQTVITYVSCKLYISTVYTFIAYVFQCICIIDNCNKYTMYITYDTLVISNFEFLFHLNIVCKNEYKNKIFNNGARGV